jgi:hypothetical protein
VRIDRRLVGFGVFLVTVGTAMLLVRNGVVPTETAQRAWTLWPLLLVGTGLSIVLAGRPGAALGGLVVAVTLGAMLGGVLASGWSGRFSVCGDAANGRPFQPLNGDLASASRIAISIDCGNLGVATAGDGGWSLSGSSPDGRPPIARTEGSSIRIEAADSGPFSAGDGRNDWQLVLPRDAAVDVDVATNGGSSTITLDGAALGDTSFETNAGSLDLDLGGVRSIGALEVRTNLGSATVRLPGVGVGGSVEVNAGSLRLCRPDGEVGLRIEVDGVVSANNLDEAGLTRDDDVWESAGYSGAATRIDLKVEVNAGSLSLDPASGCSD